MKEWLTTGIPYEVAFWNSLYSNKRELKKLMSWSRYGQEISLSNFDAVRFLMEKQSLGGGGGEKPQVLDVGCGLSYATGNYAHGELIDIHYIDPLASFYNKILRRHKQNFPLIEFGMSEYLSATTLSLQEKGIQLIIIQNALDHSANPVKGILESLNCLEIGGVLYLKHWPNEAETENYRGFHKYNITEENGELIIWNPSNSTNINQLVSSFCDITLSRGTDRESVIAVLTKKAPVPDFLFNPKEDVAVLCKNMLTVVDNFTSPRFAFRYHLKFAFYRCAQFFARFFNSETKSFLKKLLRRN